MRLRCHIFLLLLVLTFEACHSEEENKSDGDKSETIADKENKLEKEGVEQQPEVIEQKLEGAEEQPEVVVEQPEVVVEQPEVVVEQPEMVVEQPDVAQQHQEEKQKDVDDILVVHDSWEDADNLVQRFDLFSFLFFVSLPCVLSCSMTKNVSFGTRIFLCSSLNTLLSVAEISC
jgi:hypothetical protein